MKKERQFRVSCYAPVIPNHMQCTAHFAPRTRERSEFVFARESQKIPARYERVVMHQGNFKWRSWKIIQETNVPVPLPKPVVESEPLRVTDTRSDRELLPALAERLNARLIGTRRDRVSVILGGVVRDKLDLAYRWLRRFTDGPWHLGGHHVARYNFGLALCEKRQQFYTDRL